MMCKEDYRCCAKLAAGGLLFPLYDDSMLKLCACLNEYLWKRKAGVVLQLLWKCSLFAILVVFALRALAIVAFGSLCEG